jgi:hypothetical protein
MFDKKSELCLCGSGKKYSECCALKISISDNPNSFRRYMQEFDKLHNTYKKICMHPQKSECSRVKTHAHTISQKAVLELIADRGMVLMPIVFGISNEFRMEPRGIEAKATKFYCFCSKHDKMFAPIDKTRICLTEYMYFLYAYRTFASTYYKVRRELDCFYKLREKYDLTSNPLVLLMYHYMERNVIFLDEYEEKFNEAIMNETYDCLVNISISLEYKVHFAAATCFCPAIDLFGNSLASDDEGLPMIYISIIPNEDYTNIIFSWFKQDAVRYDFFAEQVKIAPRRLILKYLNNLIPMNCENMVVGPKLWDIWGEEGQNDFIKIAYDKKRKNNLKYTEKEYFQERLYNLFLKM